MCVSTFLYACSFYLEEPPFATKFESIRQSNQTGKIHHCIYGDTWEVTGKALAPFSKSTTKTACLVKTASYSFNKSGISACTNTVGRAHSSHDQYREPGGGIVPQMSSNYVSIVSFPKLNKSLKECVPYQSDIPLHAKPSDSSSHHICPTLTQLSPTIRDWLINLPKTRIAKIDAKLENTVRFSIFYCIIRSQSRW